MNENERERREQQRVRQRAARILGQRPHSRGELKRKLLLKGEAEELAELAVEWLTEERFLDDEAYAGQVARYCLRKGWDARRTKGEFYKRLVPREYWDEAIRAAQTEENP